jgi:hypothetical protein
MKKLIIYLFGILLLNSVNTISAQEYKYFNIRYSDKFSVSFSPKNLEESFFKKEGERTTMGFYTMNENYFDMFIPIYKEIFGDQYLTQYKGRDNLLFLTKIKCSFYFREDFKPYYFWVNFPASRLEEFPQWEEKLYRFCMKVLEVDVRCFIDLEGDISFFKGSTFDINMGNLYLFLEGRFRAPF